MDYTHYVALGDSMSIDLYPALDAGATEVAVNLEWKADAGGVAPLGAASLLHRNDDERFPEHAGEDLATVAPGIAFANLSEDGAAVPDVYVEQLDRLEALTAEARGERVLVTLTIGGNDLLHALMNRPAASLMKAKTRDIVDATAALVGRVTEIVPGARLLLTTVCDPSDGTGHAPGVLEDDRTIPLEHLATFNDALRALAARTPNASVADAHAAFLGHGIAAPEAERWYWRRSLIEPGLRGASELRRVWWEAI
jgi:lysophospholipase L1-like esterase